MEIETTIKSTNLTKSYYGNLIFKDLNFQIKNGTLNCLLGPNGAGKTTLLKLISTLAIPTSGNIEILGIRTSEEPEKVRTFLGVVLHPSLLYPELTLMENLKFVANCFGISFDVLQNTLEELNLVSFQNYKIKNLSCGTRKRTSLAKALILKPKILLLDEPFANLDTSSVETLKKIFIKEKEKKTTIIFTTHIYEQVKEITNNTLILEKGTLIIK